MVSKYKKYKRDYMETFPFDFSLLPSLTMISLFHRKVFLFIKDEN